jgi:hypothetical protein
MRRLTRRARYVAAWWNLADRDTGVRVPPRTWRAVCLAEHEPTTLLCSRAKGHELRHAAAASDGRVWAVWS